MKRAGQQGGEGKGAFSFSFSFGVWVVFLDD
jgi:hypothetical protein